MMIRLLIKGTFFLVLLFPAAFVHAKETPSLFPVHKHGKYGYIDRFGRVRIGLKFDDAWPFKEGLASVQIGKLRGYIDTRGRVVIKPQFKWAISFFEGLAKVEPPDSYGLFGFIDKTGKLVIKPKFRDVDNYSDGFAL